MTTVTLFGLCGAALVGLGLYGLLTHPQLLRKLVGFNLLGSGIFLIFGVIARRGGLGSGVGGDPVPQALVITAIVVAFAATALVVALLLRLFQETGRATLDPPVSGRTPQGQGDR